MIASKEELMGKNCYINKFISASNPLQKTSEILFLGKNLVLSIHIMDSFSDNHSFLYYVVRATAISPYLWMCFYTLILSNNTPILQVTSKFRTSPHAFKSSVFAVLNLKTSCSIFKFCRTVIWIFSNLFLSPAPFWVNNTSHILANRTSCVRLYYHAHQFVL